MWDKLLGVAFALLACGGAALAVLLLRWRSRHLSPAADHEQARIHPGISMHAIRIGGSGIGLVFAIGYVVMFWFGAPGYRPIVVGAATLGGLVGVLLIWLRRRTSDPVGTSMLHLDGHNEAVSGQADALERAPDNDALQLTSGPWQAGPARS